MTQTAELSNVMAHSATLYGLCIDAGLHWLATWQKPSVIHISVRKENYTLGYIEQELHRQALLRGIDPLPFSFTLAEFPHAVLITFRPLVEAVAQ